MHKRIGSICLVAGTAIGSGMIALPMVLASLGLLPSLILMFLMWCLVYYTAIVNVELNLKAGTAMHLGALGRHFSGKGAEFIGLISTAVLTYSVLAVYFYGGSSVVGKLLGGSSSEITGIATCCFIAAFFFFLLPLKYIDYVNRILFVALIAVIFTLIAGLASSIQWEHLPWIGPHVLHLSFWGMAVPVVFTAFGFQLIFHALTLYCNYDKQTLKSAFFWGSLIPAIVYMAWSCGVLGVLSDDSPVFYQKMMEGQIEVGDLVAELSKIAKWPAVQMLVWWISLLAIITSVIGLGIGICEALQEMLAKRVLSATWRRLIASFVTVLPPYIVAIFVPNAFLAVLGFAGMILTVIVIFLPIYLLKKAKNTPTFYPASSIKSLLRLSVLAGIAIALFELINMA